MTTTVRMLLHAIAAAAVFWLLQLYVLGASQGTSLLWAAAGGAGAAYLAWSQARRGG